ncbi:MAG: hypothetical protein KC502_01745 [Myxococcales bacterium]|nr:hypothetical protein [Myxococcales bacterium]
MTNRTRCISLVLLILAPLQLMAATPPDNPAAAPPAKDSGDSQREADMFGGDPEPADKSTAKKPSGSTPSPGKSAASAKSTAAKDNPTATAPSGKDYGDARWRDASVTSADTDRLKDKLDIGGLLYLRNNASLTGDTPWSRQRLSSNNLMDVYFDARPNDRVRAFVRGRLLYSPVVSDQQSSMLTGMTASNNPLNPQLVEMWVKFDIARFVYLTIGTQQMRWGATRLWNPVDVIYATRRNPLTLFDQRTGMPMVKLHFPIDSLGWNAYLVALGERADNLRNWGVAGRLEAVFSTVELGLTAMKRMDFDPRLGLDWSAGVWDVDITGELGVRVDAANEAHWMLSAGMSYTIEVGEDDSIIVGAEYFHNPEGFSSGKAAANALIDWSMKSQTNPDAAGPMPLTFFYTGKHYASLFAVMMGPGSWDDTSFTVSAIGNLSDRTGFVQLLVSTRVLQDLRVEGFVAANVGDDGEFRFYSGYINDAAGTELLPRPVGQLGLNLRMSF